MKTIANNNLLRETTSEGQNVPGTGAAYAACLWSLVYAGLGLYWSSGGAGFPFGDARAADMGSVFVHAKPETTGRIIAGLGLLGSIAALMMIRPFRRRWLSTMILSFAWTICLVLLLVIPDLRLLQDLAYGLLGVFQTFDLPALNQVFCIGGGILWGATAITYQRYARKACIYCGRNTTGNPENSISHFIRRWGTVTAYVAVISPLPWAVIRLSWFAGIPLGVSEGFWSSMKEGVDPGFIKYVFGTLPVAGSLLTLGLIQSWGEIFPRWFPKAGGKQVPLGLAVIPGMLVALVVTVAGIRLWPYFLASFVDGSFDVSNWAASLPAFFFLPWGVSLGMATLAYYYRRRKGCRHCKQL